MDLSQIGVFPTLFPGESSDSLPRVGALRHFVAFVKACSEASLGGAGVFADRPAEHHRDVHARGRGADVPGVAGVELTLTV